MPPKIRKMKARDFFELYNGDIVAAMSSRNTNSTAQTKT